MIIYNYLSFTIGVISSRKEFAKLHEVRSLVPKSVCQYDGIDCDSHQKDKENHYADSWYE